MISLNGGYMAVSLNIRTFILFSFLILMLSFVACGSKKSMTVPTTTGSTTTTKIESVPAPETEQPLTEDSGMSEFDLAEQCAGNLQPIFFEYNSYELGQDQLSVVEANAKLIAAAECSKATISIEGHTDERGTEEYNLALGEHRAEIVREQMVNFGVSPDRLQILSFGEALPFNQSHNEEGWAANRRVQFVPFNPRDLAETESQ
jgi:peptidoglycan-associated lipoprotein